MHTLLLNASYEPLCVITVRRAVVLVLADKADIVAEADGWIRSARTSLAAPSVIRLRGYVRVPYRATLPLNRRNLVARDRGRCAYCPGRGDTVDHVVPRSRGGQHVWTNVVAACQPCNGRKGDRLLAELGWTLPFTPVAPRGWSWLVVGIGTTDPAWAEWLAPTARA
ncbi:MAG: endonuclease [Acidimicrobiales bacterium]|nr:endonuclease [Acidimicrobiales bacterium]